MILTGLANANTNTNARCAVALSVNKLKYSMILDLNSANTVMDLKSEGAR